MGGVLLTRISVLQSVGNEVRVACVGLVIYLPIQCEGWDEGRIGHQVGLNSNPKSNLVSDFEQVTSPL